MQIHPSAKRYPDLSRHYWFEMRTTLYRLFPDRIVKTPKDRGLLVNPLGLPPGLIENAPHYTEPGAFDHPYAVLTETFVEDPLAKILSYNRKGWMDDGDHRILRLHGGLGWLMRRKNYKHYLAMLQVLHGLPLIHPNGDPAWVYDFKVTVPLLIRAEALSDS
jgi:hypothetical protein